MTMKTHRTMDAASSSSAVVMVFVYAFAQRAYIVPGRERICSLHIYVWRTVDIGDLRIYGARVKAIDDAAMDGRNERTIEERLARKVHVDAHLCARHRCQPPRT